MPESPFFRALAFWDEFNTGRIDYEVTERTFRSYKWTFISLAKYTMTNIVCFSSLPLNIVAYLGVIFSLDSGILIGLGIWAGIFRQYMMR